MGKFLKCPNCGSEEFMEWAKQETMQSGVRIDIRGTIDYDDAEAWEPTDNFDILGYICQECDHDLQLRGKKLYDVTRKKR